VVRVLAAPADATVGGADGRVMLPIGERCKPSTQHADQPGDCQTFLSRVCSTFLPGPTTAAVALFLAIERGAGIGPWWVRGRTSTTGTFRHRCRIAAPGSVSGRYRWPSSWTKLSAERGHHRPAYWPEWGCTV